MTDIEGILNALTDYVTVLERSIGTTSFANDRPIYQGHLAVAASMYAAVHRGASPSELREKVAEERHAYGWGYLQGNEGAAAETAFH
jgi:hypothetical protein